VSVSGDGEGGVVRELIATVGLEELERRKAWLDLTPPDVDVIQRVGQEAVADQDQIVEGHLRHFQEDPHTADSFNSETDVQRFRELQFQYLALLAAGDLGTEYAENRVQVGALHQRIGVDPKWYIGACGFRLRQLTEHLPDARTPEAWRAIEKLILLDLGIVLDTYLTVRERTIEEQQQALRELAVRQQEAMIRELSTPVLQIREGLLILPIVGTINSQRAQMLTQSVLEAIRDRRSRVVVLDITGVPAVDSAVANHLVQTVDACRLMGASVIVTGLSPEVAQTIVTVGIDLSKMTTVGDLEGGLEAAERLLSGDLSD
jgi:rsbT co-antagonist protein RsbR